MHTQVNLAAWLGGASGAKAGKVGDSPPDRVDKLFGLYTPFRQAVYSSTWEWRFYPSGEVDMYLTRVLRFGSWGYHGHNKF